MVRILLLTPVWTRQHRLRGVFLICIHKPQTLYMPSYRGHAILPGISMRDSLNMQILAVPIIPPLTRCSFTIQVHMHASGVLRSVGNGPLLKLP